METCRTCARCDFEDENKWLDLFHTTRCQREIEEMRVEFNNWQLQISPNDGLPQKICSDCFSKFCNVFTFRLQCQQAQVKLNNIFDKIETQSMDDDRFDDNLEELNAQLLRIVEENTRQIENSTSNQQENNCQIDNCTADAATSNNNNATTNDNNNNTTTTTPSAAAIAMLDMLNENSATANNYTTAHVNASTTNATNATTNGVGGDECGEILQQLINTVLVMPKEVSTKTNSDTVLVKRIPTTTTKKIRKRRTTRKRTKNTSNADAITQTNFCTASVGVECQSETEMEMELRLTKMTKTPFTVTQIISQSDNVLGEKLTDEGEITKENKNEAAEVIEVEEEEENNSAKEDKDAEEEAAAGHMNEQMDLHVDDIIEEDFENNDDADADDDEAMTLMTMELMHDDTAQVGCIITDGSLTQLEGRYANEESVPFVETIEEEEEEDGEAAEVQEEVDEQEEEQADYYDENEDVLESFEPVTLPTNTFHTNNNTIQLATTTNSTNSSSTKFTSNFSSSTSSTINYNSSSTFQHISEPQEVCIVFECKYCYKTKDMPSTHFETQRALLEHITSAHDAEYPFTCPQGNCKEGFRDAASRTVHMKSEHVAKHYECDVCGKKYADRFNLRHHYEKFHSKMDFGCETCEKRFYSRKSLNYHMKWHNPELLLKCSHCDRLFINQRHLKCHEETHNGVRNSECCTFCGKTFIHLKTLRWHLYRQHGGEKPYKCGHCTEVFASYLEKRIHMLENHLENLTTIERTECMLCRQHYDSEHDLSEHIRSKHIERPKSSVLLIANNKRVVRSKRQKNYSGIFQCEICGQRFNMKSALERHAAVHSSIGRPHKCPVESCAKRFKRAQDMNWHMKTHSNEKPNVCDVCGKGFALKYVLNQHKRSHEVLEKNFKCQICGRAYLFEKSLRVHERVHTGETYYRCDLCGENFVTHMKFKTHMMKNHDPSTTNLDDYNLDVFDEQMREP